MPDFIVIGAMKAATSTLHEQLARQDGLVMSEPKEPSFFSNDEQWSRGLDWYASLFAAAGPDDLCGESSTHYTKLPTYPRTIERMQAHLPAHARFVYIIRHPIDRLVSQYIHEWTQRIISEPIDEALDTHRELIDYSRCAMQLEPFIAAFGRARIMPLFFDQVSRRPQRVLEEVCRFIGYQRSPRWVDDLAAQNISTERLRKSAFRDAVVNFPGVTALRRTLVPQSVRDWIKSFWIMRQRPQLSDESLRRLRGIFNEDLAVLGRWFDLDLNCDTFKDVARRTIPRWADQPHETVA